ncbi:MAG: hypothetical protein HQ549_06505 [Candidatus Omnitrophica bacterium]|nr:hypothetical protein [Candidatus Omnitrophota bacterium]
MSIIAEALKKAQETSAKTIVPQPVKQPVKTTKKHNSRLYGIIVVCVLLLFSGVVVFSFLNPGIIKTNTEERIYDSPAPGKMASKTEDPPSMSETVVEKEENKINALKSPGRIGTADITERLQLNGIMYTPGKPLVVINDNVWAEGDTVSGFKILKIEENSVKVASNGQEFIIRLKR